MKCGHKAWLWNVEEGIWRCGGCGALLTEGQMIVWEKLAEKLAEISRKLDEKK